MTLRIGIDTGGTFTDLVILDETTGAVTVAKSASTPESPARAIFDAFALSGIAPARAGSVVVGTTVGTNAVLERRGARVIYLTTAGFEDVPIIGRVDKKDPYDIAWRKAEPFVERRDCVGLDERVAHDGSVVTSLRDDELERAARSLGSALGRDDPRDTAIAVNLLFSFANPEHERRTVEFLRTRFPDVPISASHEVSAVWRELERGSTTILDAYLTPVVRRLVDTLDVGLRERGFSGPISIMKSNGGQMLADEASNQAVQTVLSGLSGGIVAGAAFGALAGEPDAITFDMGGTSADIGLVRAGAVAHVADYELEFGVPIASAAIDLVTLGAGGGSIAWIDDGGLLRVGPQSAGAVPGPVCYGTGSEPTVTDANLVLGRLDPGYFLGGRIALDRLAAVRSLEALGARLGLGVDETAQAVIDVANATMANAIRRAAIDRGVDPRDFALVAFGGAGPLHAADIAASLGMRCVVVPTHPGLASAYGTLLADRRADRRFTRHCRSDAVDFGAVNHELERMSGEAIASLVREGFSGTPTVVRSASMRYAGQNYERELPLPPGPLDERSLETLLAAFHAQHEEAYGFAFADEVVELIHFVVSAIGPSAPPELPALAARESPLPVTDRPVWFGDRAFPTAVYRRDALGAGHVIEGPAIVEEDDSTTLVPPGHALHVLHDGIFKILGAAHERAAEQRDLDGVTLSIVGDQLVNIAEEMGTHMMRSAYSPIFSESRDFSCALFDGYGRMVAQGAFNPAHLGAITETVRAVLDGMPADRFAPGDVVIHNDPYRGGCHMPEHMLLAPVYHDGELVAFSATIGHMAEIGAMAVGSFAADATEVFQEGLRLPPVRLVAEGRHVDDVWKIILSNHRTPRSTWGDLHAMLGSLRVADQRLDELFRRLGRGLVLAAFEELLDHGERLMRRRIEAIPDGEYRFSDAMEDDGITAEPSRIEVAVVVRGDHAIVDYSGTDAQARGPINATFGVAVSATYNAFLQVSGTGLPRNAGAYRCLTTIAPPGSLVNVAFPGPSVGGNTETQPKLVGALLGAFAPVLPGDVMAAEGVTSCNFLFGGVHPDTGEPYAHYHFEASGWGGRIAHDGDSARNHIHGNCRNTPVEVFEARFPFRTLSYGLVPDSGGPGRRRGGLAVRRVLEVTAPEVTASALMDRVKQGAWGLFGGDEGACAAILVRRAGEPSFQTFCDAFGTVSPSKFAGIALRLGDRVLLQSAGGGGYGAARERDPALVLHDVEQGYVSRACAESKYAVALAGQPGDLVVDEPGTRQLRELHREDPLDLDRDPERQ